jgi:host factor-I protein
LLLRRDGNAQLVYKHAISTIMPGHPPADLTLLAAGEGGNGKKPMLQDLFLNAAARQHEPMTVFLVNGVMLQGSVAGFDQFSMLLERGGQVQLVYKHAISTMQPGHPLNLTGESQAEEEA